MKLSKTVGTEV